MAQRQQLERQTVELERLEQERLAVVPELRSQLGLEPRPQRELELSQPAQQLGPLAREPLQLKGWPLAQAQLKAERH